MEIRHLQTFIAIVELGGFTKAAENLGYAQSTITAHIQILERELGRPLFDRLGKKTILTNTGKSMLPYAKEILDIYKKINSLTEDEISGELVIGAGESLCIYRLGKVLKKYKEKFPKVNIIIKNSNCNELRNMLYNGEVDLIFTIEPEISDKDLIVKKLKDENMVIVGENDLISGGSVLFSEKGCSARKSFEKYLQESNIKVDNILELSSIELIKNCAINGLGFSFLPLYVVEKEANEGSVKTTLVEEKYNNFKTQLIYHKNKNITIVMEKLIEMIEYDSYKW